MATEDAAERRLKFYGPNDYGTFWQVERAADFLERYEPPNIAPTLSDVLELHNAAQFAEHDFFPASYSEEQRAACRARVPQLRSAVGRYFNALDETNIAEVIVDVDFEYHSDLLELLGSFKVFDRCPAATVLPVLDATRIHLGEMLANRQLVRAYDEALQARLIADAENAEFLIRKYLEKDVRREVYLPSSLTVSEARALLEAYLDSDEANLSFVELVANAPLKKELGLDAKLKLKAKRKHDRWTEDFFKENSGIQFGCEVGIDDDQTEPMLFSSDGSVTKLSYSRRWLEENLDYPTIFNNFLYLFEFTDRRMLLTLPSFEAQRGVFERFMGVAGRDAYPVGAAFRLKEQASFLQTLLYQNFLRSQGVELEAAVAWFFANYLQAEFGAANLRFVPSSRASSYLEKCRHLFAEMESVVKQFSLYVENGALDTGLLAIASEQVRYKTIPSRVLGKYVYATSDRDIRQILHLMFSDQSGLTYINEGLRASDAARLLIDNRVAYEDFHDYQQRQVDYLIDKGVLVKADQRVHFANVHQFRVLRELFDCEATSYLHHPAEGRASIDAMVAKGWLVRRSSLLTEAEASYFNYCLNQFEFSNGPDLRNRYLHGSHIDASDEDEHFRTYITALKLLIALVIKMNDDFWLCDEEEPAHE